MRLPEQRFWDRVRGNLLKIDPKLLLERVENVAATGTPDVHAKGRGEACWIELKAVLAPPVRESTPLLGKSDGLSQDQKNWFLEYHRHNGRCAVLVGVGSRELFLVHGSYAQALNGWSISTFRRLAIATNYVGVTHFINGGLPNED